jgi:hypothetical protein
VTADAEVIGHVIRGQSQRHQPRVAVRPEGASSSQLTRALKIWLRPESSLRPRSTMRHGSALSLVFGPPSSSPYSVTRAWNLYRFMLAARLLFLHGYRIASR